MFWTDDEFDEFAQEFFCQKGAALTQQLLLHATDLESFSKYLRRSIRNFLTSMARTTPTGRIRRKLEDLLRAGAFEETDGWWRNVDDFHRPNGYGVGVLIRAAYEVPYVQVKRWSGDRTAPMASDEDVTGILAAVLAVSGSVDVATLTQVFVERFPPVKEALESEPGSSVTDGGPIDRFSRPEEVAATRDTAGRILSVLSPREQALLLVLDEGPSDQQAVTGLGRSQTAVEVARLKTRLQDLIPYDELAPSIIGEVAAQCASRAVEQQRPQAPSG